MNPLVQLHILRMFQTLNTKLKFGTLSLLVIWLTDYRKNQYCSFFMSVELC